MQTVCTNCKLKTRLTVDIFEELKNINNSGIDRDELLMIEKEKDINKYEGDNVMQILGIWNSIKTKRLLEIIDECNGENILMGNKIVIITNLY